MLFKETASKKPVIVLLHGGGLSDWSLQKIVKRLEADFHLVTPVIDGHGENGGEEFVSIKACAQKLIDHIDSVYGGRVFALGGLSLGGQIAVEVLSRRPDISEYAVIESALVVPIKVAGAIAAPMYKLFYGLIRSRRFARMQAKSLEIPEEMFESYYQDSMNMSKRSLVNITISNSRYALDEKIALTTAKVLIIVGEREMRVMKKSAYLLHRAIDFSRLYIAPAMKHGQFSILHPDEYVKVLLNFLEI
ncbi:MAG: alpha/beta fold hydrolase [Christensenellales bacterium]|jgi:pimeloyl-ACP methyl ester carboxylesterase